MDSFFQNYLSLFPDDAKLLAACNDKTRAYGLLLSPADLKELGAARETARHLKLPSPDAVRYLERYAEESLAPRVHTACLHGDLSYLFL